MSYPRPNGSSTYDFAAAREWELEVGTWLGNFRIEMLDSPDRMDHFVPGCYVDCKEKKQRLSPRWHLLPNVPEENLFVVDELAVRKAMAHFPNAYFLIRDVPSGGRIFLARIDEVVCSERIRVNRVGKTGHRKGKWIVDLSNFRELSDPPSQLLPTVLSDQTTLPWKASHCVTMKQIMEI